MFERWQGLVVDDEVAGGCQLGREFGIAMLELPGSYWAIADAAVPGLQELLGGMTPLPRDQQLELHGGEPLSLTPALGESDELATDALFAVLVVGDQHPEFTLAGSSRRTWMTPTIRPLAIATAICPTSIDWAIFSGVVRDVPAVQSPSSAIAYTRFTSDASSLTSEVSAAA